MLTITVPGIDLFDESTEEFSSVDGAVLELEHSLVSLSKWESIFEKPFLGGEEKTTEEVIAYIKAMTLTPRVPEEIFSRLTHEDYKRINDHIDAKMSATWFNEAPGSNKNSEQVTSELIYYWMTAFQIPPQYETWHLNRLFTLIRICSVKQSKPKKMSRSEIAARNRKLNEERKAQLNTTG